MNKLELIKEVLRFIDIDVDSALNWLNEGYMILGKAAKIYAEAKVTPTTNNNLYELPSNFIRLEGVKTNRWYLTRIDAEDTDDSTGTITNYFKLGNKLGFYPKGTEEITIQYYKYPNKLTNDSDMPVIPEEYHNAMVSYALAKALESNENDERASFFMSQFDLAKKNLEIIAKENESFPKAIKNVYGGI